MPYAPRAASAGAAAAIIMLTPGNDWAFHVGLGDGLRARTSFDDRRVRVEQRTSPGLFGAGFGATWEELPVGAERSSDADRRPVIAIDRDQLAAAVGAERAAQVAQIPGIVMSGPSEKEGKGEGVPLDDYDNPGKMPNRNDDKPPNPPDVPPLRRMHSDETLSNYKSSYNYWSSKPT